MVIWISLKNTLRLSDTAKHRNYMNYVQKILFFTFLFFFPQQQIKPIHFLGYDLSEEKNSDMIDIIRSAAYIPSIVTSTSAKPRVIILGSLLAATATGFKMVQELVKKPNTPIWQQLFCNLPLIGLCAGNVLFDVSRINCSKRVAQKNQTKPRNDFKINQGFCLGIELFLRWGALCSKNVADGKSENKKLSSALSFMASMVEQWRLNSRWFNAHSGLPRIDYSGVFSINNNDSNAVKLTKSVINDKEKNDELWLLEEVSQPLPLLKNTSN